MPLAHLISGASHAKNSINRLILLHAVLQVSRTDRHLGFINYASWPKRLYTTTVATRIGLVEPQQTPPHYFVYVVAVQPTPPHCFVYKVIAFAYIANSFFGTWRMKFWDCNKYTKIRIKTEETYNTL